MYLTFAEYQAYGGTETSETAFNDLEFEAASVIDWYTFGRLRKDTEFSEEVKRCDFKLISFIQDKMTAEAVDPSGTSGGVAAGIASQSNDGVSVSYNIMSAKDIIENSRAEMAATVNRYLAYTVNSLGQKVLFRGLYKNE